MYYSLFKRYFTNHFYHLEYSEFNILYIIIKIECCNNSGNYKHF